MKKRNLKKFLAFTISEVMLTTVIIASIIAISIPVAIGTRPSTEKVMLKKAYNTAENIISDLVSNELFYPSDVLLFDLSNPNFTQKTPSYFMNEETPAMSQAMLDLVLEMSSSNPTTHEICSRLTPNISKLSALFMCSFRIVPERNGCYDDGGVEKHFTTGCVVDGDTTCRFATPDGILWITKDSVRTTDVTTVPIFIITVYVGGKRGDCYRSMHSTINDDNPQGKQRTDKFDFMVYYNGRIFPDTNAQDVLTKPYSNKIQNY